MYMGNAIKREGWKEYDTLVRLIWYQFTDFSYT